MIPVKQSITMPAPLPEGITVDQLIDASVVVPGDCMRAAVASICEFALDEVPHFAAYRACGELTDNHLWWYAMVGWLHLQGVDAAYCMSTEPPSGWSIAEGMSPRGIPHVVVAFDGEYVHDPHPAGGFLTALTGFYKLTPRNPWAQHVLDRRRSVAA